MQDTWDAVASQVRLSSLLARERQLDEQIWHLQAERSDVRKDIDRLRRDIDDIAAYEPEADAREQALRLVPLFLGDRAPHAFQIQAACAMHAGLDVFVIEKAGRGKSLCFQLAGLMQPPLAQPSAPRPSQLTVVVAPLLALAHEQAAAINATRTYVMANGERMHAAYVLDGYSGELLRDLDGATPVPTFTALVSLLRGEGCAPPLHPGSAAALLLDRLQQVDDSGNGTCIFVFVSPEKLVRSAALHALVRSAYELGVWRKVVIDEAHCVDEHGREFRADYLLLGAMRVAFPALAFMCLTATAPPAVVASTCLTLRLNGDLVLLRGRLKRPQMRYAVRFMPNARAKEEIISEAVARAHERGTSTLVYTNSRRSTEQLAQAMRESCGVTAPAIDAYHAGMPPEQRREIEASWRESETMQLSATIAMGMGMDKPDLDAVIHHQPPRSISSLYQEASRAARAGQCGKWDGIFTLTDVFDLLERRHGQLAEGRYGHEYGWGTCIELLEFLTNAETCRHVLLERALGAGGEAEAGLCCQAGEPQCDNCEHMASRHLLVMTLVRKDWIPALLQVMREQEQASNGSLSLRAFAIAWLRSTQAPTPKWVRTPLLIFALLHDVLCVSFVAIHSYNDNDILRDRPRIVRWSAHVSIDVRGRCAAHSSPALQSVRLHASMWQPIMQASEKDGIDKLAEEIATGERSHEQSDLEISENGSDRDWDDDETEDANDGNVV